MKSARVLVCIAGLALVAVGEGCAAPYTEDEEGRVDDQASGLSSPTASADATSVTYRIPFSSAPRWVRVFLDTDRDATTGFRGYGVGAQFLVENGTLYRYSGAGGAWGWTRVKSVTSVLGPDSATVTVLRADIGNPAALDVVTQTDPPLQTSGKITQILSGGTPPPPPPPTTTDPAPTGPVFYVSPSGNDANPGTLSAPWRTIQKAADTLVAGDTAILLDGVYEEGSINFRRSGAAGKPITIRAQNKWGAVVSSTSSCNPGFSIYASYVTVKNLRFTLSPRNVQCGIYTSSNVHIRAWNSVVASPSNPTTGYVGFVADGVKTEGGLQRSDGIKSNQDFTVIQNCEADSDLELFATKDSIMRNNVVVGQNKFGISLLAKGGVRNAQVYGNVVRVKSAGGFGVILGGYSCDTCFFDTSTKIEAYNAVAYDNVVVNESGGSISALMFQGAKDSAFLNNVVIGGQLAMAPGGHNTGFQFPTTNPRFENNIVVCNGPTAPTAMYSGTAVFDYNDFFNCSGAPGQAHPVVGDPRFVNPTSDWHLLAGSPALNSGAPVTMPAYGGGTIDVSRDKDGVVRTVPWDLGVYAQP